MRFVFTVSLSVLISLPVFAKELVKVGNEVITSEDLANKKAVLNKAMPLSSILKDSYILDTIILYHLGLMEARQNRMDQDPEARKAMDTALFDYYLFKTVDEKIMNLKPDETELREYYKKDPELTFKRYVIPATQKTLSSAKSKLALIRNDINSGKMKLDDLINKAPKHELSSLDGLHTRIGAYTLTEPERNALIRMQPGEISPVLDMGAFVELIQLVKKYSFAEASIDRIIDSYKREKLTEGRIKIIRDLKTKYSNIIQYYK